MHCFQLGSAGFAEVKMAAGRANRGILGGLNRRGLRGHETTSPSAADALGRPKGFESEGDQFLAAKIGPRPPVTEGAAKKAITTSAPLPSFFDATLKAHCHPPP